MKTEDWHLSQKSEIGSLNSEDGTVKCGELGRPFPVIPPPKVPNLIPFLIGFKYSMTDVCYILSRLQTMYKSSRLDSVLQSIQVTGTYEHTAPELAFGAQLAWRNASRCIGRISWSNLQVLNLNAIIDFPFVHCFQFNMMNRARFC